MERILIQASGLYDKPLPDEVKVKVWFDSLKKYDGKTMEQALVKYSEKGKFFPKVADLVECYWQVWNERKKAEVEQAKSRLHTKECQYCGGTGWFSTKYKNKWGHWESYVCECVCQKGNPKNLNLALSSKDFRWSKSEKAFIPLTEWIGDVQTDTVPDEIDFDNCFGQIKMIEG